MWSVENGEWRVGPEMDGGDDWKHGRDGRRRLGEADSGEGGGARAPIELTEHVETREAVEAGKDRMRTGVCGSGSAVDDDRAPCGASNRTFDFAVSAGANVDEDMDGRAHEIGIP